MLVWKMEGSLGQEMPLEVESDPQLTANEEVRTSVPQLYGTEFSHQCQ